MGVKRSSASVYMSVCLSFCPHDRTKTAETTITKLATRIVHHEQSGAGAGAENRAERAQKRMSGSGSVSGGYRKRCER